MSDTVLFLLLPSLLTLGAVGWGVFAAEASRKELLRRVATLEEALARQPGVVRDEIGREAAAADRRTGALRTELAEAVKGLGDSLDKRLTGFTGVVEQRLKDLGELDTSNFDKLADSQSRRLGETNALVVDLAKLIGDQQEAGRKSAEAAMEKLRETLAANLETLRKENEGKLEQMRATVEEKLQGTLEQRIGESFKQVSERLEAVQRGLGEMQTLATGVGDLKRVLTNVKSRGGWGEVQLGMLLEDMLTPDQYEVNAQVRPRSAERVEYAVLLPGQGEEKLKLPIDSKFPQEDYDRLLTAQEAGSAEEVEAAAKALERAVRAQAKTICDKYVHPPHSTDFAVMYLPTEGLYAEVARRPGLMSDLQTQHRINVAGPSTLSAFLNSLQMGFRTLAIQKRTSEVWQVLGEAKAEFEKYGQVWDKLVKQLDTAKNTAEEAGRRTRAVAKKLKGVEALDGAPQLVAIEGGLSAATVDEDVEVA